MRATIRDDVVRIGPFGDVYAGHHYVEFLAGLMPTLPGYAMEVSRVTYVDDGSRAVAELSETVTVDGSPATLKCTLSAAFRWRFSAASLSR